MRKGNLVTTTRPTNGHRPMTRAESEAWYTNAYTNWGPHNCAGESWVHSGVMDVPLAAGTQLMVIRARCSARTGWCERPGYAEVVGADGVPLKVPRAALALA